MKPTKNRFFCNDCGKIKIRFETEDKANRFIKFNADEIESETGVRPERSYYCISCDSWHITSKKNKSVKSRTEVVIDEYNKSKEEGKRNKKQEIKEQTDKETKLKREGVNELIKKIESNIDTIKFFKKLDKKYDYVEILNESYSVLKEIKTSVLELESIYRNILSEVEFDKLFLNKQEKIKELENELNLFS